MTKAVDLPPPPETGVHGAIMGNARRLWLAGFEKERALHYLIQWRDRSTFRPGRTVQDKELLDAVDTAWRSGPNTGLYSKAHRTFSRVQRWPEPNPTKRAGLIDPNFHLVTLWENSPWTRGNTDEPQTRFILERLFPGDPLVCMGWDKESFDTKPLSEWKHPERMQLVVPSPMASRTGPKKDGSGESAHTLANTGPRRFLVADFDDRASLDIHAAAAWHLGTHLPLVLVLSTGGKGLHAWFKTDGRTDEKLLPFFTLAVECGADPRMWLRSQFARIPDGSRDDGGAGIPQTVYYFNPEAVV
ncbi:MAG: hypothetical protein EBS01_10950 [Verrucomicrobia bacterium]|nr:hypothetical protein [Verrucomicrobiota bacterium]